MSNSLSILQNGGYNFRCLPILILFLAIAAEKKHEDFKAGIAGFDKKSQLKKSNTIEKNTLPSKEDIEAEKAA